MMRKTSLALAVAAVALSGCIHRLDAPMSKTFGEAYSSMDVQIIPARPSSGPPESSAARAVLAIRRYDADRPAPLQSAGTSAQSGGYAPTPPADTPPPQ